VIVSNIYSKTVKTLSYEIEIMDCKVKDLLVGNQEFGENLGFDAAIKESKSYAFKNFT